MVEQPIVLSPVPQTITVSRVTEDFIINMTMTFFGNESGLSTNDALEIHFDYTVVAITDHGRTMPFGLADVVTYAPGQTVALVLGRHIEDWAHPLSGAVTSYTSLEYVGGVLGNSTDIGGGDILIVGFTAPGHYWLTMTPYLSDPMQQLCEGLTVELNVAA